MVVWGEDTDDDCGTSEKGTVAFVHVEVVDLV